MIVIQEKGEEIRGIIFPQKEERGFFLVPQFLSQKIIHFLEIGLHIDQKIMGNMTIEEGNKKKGKGPEKNEKVPGEEYLQPEKGMEKG